MTTVIGRTAKWGPPGAIAARPPTAALISFMMAALLFLAAVSVARAQPAPLAMAAEAAATRFLDAVEGGGDVSALAAPELMQGLPAYLATYSALGGPRLNRKMIAFQNLGVGPFGLTVQIEIVSSYPRGALVQTLIISGVDNRPHILRLEWRGA